MGNEAAITCFKALLQNLSGGTEEHCGYQAGQQHSGPQKDVVIKLRLYPLWCGRGGNKLLGEGTFVACRVEYKYTSLMYLFSSIHAHLLHVALSSELTNTPQKWSAVRQVIHRDLDNLISLSTLRDVTTHFNLQGWRYGNWAIWCSQKPALELYREPVDTRLQSHQIPLRIDFITILPFTKRPLNWNLPPIPPQIFLRVTYLCNLYFSIYSR